MVNQSLSDVHESSTCQLGVDGGPCDLCAMVNESAITTPADDEADDFACAWTIGPTAMKRTTEIECAEYWYQVGRRDERAARMMEQVTDLTEMRRVARERLG